MSDPDPRGATPSRASLRHARGRRRRARTAIAWVAFGLVMVLLIGGGYGWYSYRHFTDGITRVNAIPAGSDQPKHDVDGTDMNILLVGNDERPKGMTKKEYAELHTTEDGGSIDTDTMIVVHVPADGSRATMISLPRDVWINIPGFGPDKLNQAYVDGRKKGGEAGGAQLLIRTVQNLTGLTIDHYVKVSLLGFYTIAKALGPVQVCLKEATVDPYSGANFTAGVQTIGASQALAFVRQRHGLPDYDLSRAIRQQYFISVEAHKLLSAGVLLNPITLGNALTAISGSLETDQGFDLLRLAAQLKGLAGGNIRSATIPVTFGTAEQNGYTLDVDVINPAQVKRFIARAIGQPLPGATAGATSTPKPSGTRTTTSPPTGSATPKPPAGTHAYSSATCVY